MRENKKIGRSSGFGFMGINIAILASAALFLVISDVSYRNRVRTDTLRDSKFLTTEWHLMRELKERTDQELRDKDQEIAELRRRYVGLKDSGSPSELLAAIEDEMRKAEAEREAILAAHLKTVADPPAEKMPAAAPAIVDVPRGPSPAVERPVKPDTALTELLRNRIQALEESLRVSLASKKTIERELESLRRTVARIQGPAYAEAVPSPPVVQSTYAPEAPSRDTTDELVDTILVALARERDTISDPATVLGISDLKTRALIRAIVRTPAIRAEYPDLQDAFDRYLSLAGQEEYLRGKRETFTNLITTIDALKANRGK